MRRSPIARPMHPDASCELPLTSRRFVDGWSDGQIFFDGVKKRPGRSSIPRAVEATVVIIRRLPMKNAGCLTKQP